MLSFLLDINQMVTWLIGKPLLYHVHVPIKLWTLWTDDRAFQAQKALESLRLLTQVL